MTSVVVFDYGFGNVRSMVRALANLGLDTTLWASRSCSSAATSTQTPPKDLD